MGHVVDVDDRAIDRLDRQVVELLDRVGLPFSLMLYSNPPTFSVPAGMISFWAFTALTTSFAETPCSAVGADRDRPGSGAACGHKGTGSRRRRHRQAGCARICWRDRRALAPGSTPRQRELQQGLGYRSELAYRQIDVRSLVKEVFDDRYAVQRLRPGARRFGEIQRGLRLAKNILSAPAQDDGGWRPWGTAPSR
jgi:hypothetical protein